MQRIAVSSYNTMWDRGHKHVWGWVEVGLSDICLWKCEAVGTALFLPHGTWTEHHEESHVKVQSKYCLVDNNHTFNSSTCLEWIMGEAQPWADEKTQYFGLLQQVYMQQSLFCNSTVLFFPLSCGLTRILRIEWFLHQLRTVLVCSALWRSHAVI